MASDGRPGERKVAKYLGCEADEHGSRRDWKDLHDLSVDGLDNRTWIVEVKHWRWCAGPGSTWTLLDNAYDQCLDAMERSGLDAQNWCYPVAIYVPKHSSTEDALAYLEIDGQRCIMRLEEFRARYIDAERED